MVIMYQNIDLVLFACSGKRNIHPHEVFLTHSMYILNALCGMHVIITPITQAARRVFIDIAKHVALITRRPCDSGRHLSQFTMPTPLPSTMH